MSKYEPRVYNDGVCFIVKENESSTSFAAKKNGKKIEDFEKLFRLMFEEKSIREQDIDFAEANSRTLNRKIKTQLVTGWKSTNKIIIENVLYDIINADIDRKNREIYFYLEEVLQLVET